MPLDPAQVALLQQIAGQIPGARTATTGVPIQSGTMGSAHLPEAATQGNGWASGSSSGGGGYDSRATHSGFGRDPRQDGTVDDRSQGGYGNEPYNNREYGRLDVGRGGYAGRGSFGDRGRWNDGRRGSGRRDWEDRNGGRRRSRSPPPRDRFPGASSFSPVQKDPRDGMSPHSQPTEKANEIPVHVGSQPEVTGPPGVGLTDFDYSTFDPNSADSWTRLGEAWKVTNGTYPTQDEVMMFVMSSMAMGGPMVPGFGVSADPGDAPAIQQAGYSGQYGASEGAGYVSGYPGGGFQHDGSDTVAYDTSQSRNGESDSSNVNEAGASTALKSMTEASPPSKLQTRSSNPSTSIVDAVIAEQQNGTTGGDEGRAKTGKMIKVGDRWRWVKADTEG